MNVALPWILLSLIGGGLALMGFRNGEADAMAATLLADDPEEASARRGKDKARSIDPARRKAWLIGGLTVGALMTLIQGSIGLKAGVFALLGAAAGEIYHRGKADRDRKIIAKRLEFFLPLAMERVVMAVGSGLDIIPALNEAARKNTDPVSDVFRRVVALSESGLRVEQAIASVSNEVPSSSVKHALVHLGLAYKQGGEVVRPLKELSDATQTQYQETIEEEIAKLPVKAVVPLLLTFTGLIVCFLTVPVMQVSTTLEKLSDVGN